MIHHVVGIDEAGRGPLAGPVFVAGVLLRQARNPNIEILDALKGVKDSKKLSEKQRNEWFTKIETWQEEGVLTYTYAYTPADVIDTGGIVPAISLALAETLTSLDAHVDTRVLLDGGLHAPEVYTDQETIIRGDETEPLIALASIMAKVKRDEIMCRYAEQFPEYGFERHKGYGTALHREAIKEHGPCEIHRKTFLHMQNN